MGQQHQPKQQAPLQKRKGDSRTTPKKEGRNSSTAYKKEEMAAPPKGAASPCVWANVAFSLLWSGAASASFGVVQRSFFLFLGGGAFAPLSLSPFGGVAFLLHWCGAASRLSPCGWCSLPTCFLHVVLKYTSTTPVYQGHKHQRRKKEAAAPPKIRVETAAPSKRKEVWETTHTLQGWGNRQHCSGGARPPKGGCVLSFFGLVLLSLSSVSACSARRAKRNPPCGVAAVEFVEG